MATTAKVIIKGQNNIGKAVKSASADLGSLKDSAAKLGSMLKTAFSVTAIIATVKKLGSAVSDCFSNYAEAERSYRQLAFAIGDTEAYTKLTGVISDLSKQTLYQKGDIEEMVAELAALGKSSDEIEKITSASVYLSNVTGKDLNSSMTALLNTFNGTTSQIERMGINIDELTKEQLANGAAVDKVIDSLGGYSKAMAEADTSQHLTNIKNTWGDIKQAIGGVLDFNFGPMIADFDTFLSDSYTNIASVIQYIGAMISNIPDVVSLALDSIWEMIKKTFEWESIKTIISVAIENTLTLVAAAIKAIFTTLPDALSALGTGILTWISYIGTNLREEITNALSDAFSIGWLEAIQHPLGKWILGKQEVTYKGKTQALKDFSHKDQNDIIEQLEKGTLALAATLTDRRFFKDPEGTTQKYANLFGLTSKEDQKEAVDAAFSQVGVILKDGFTEEIKTVETSVSETVDALNEVYGPIVAGFKGSLDEIVAPDLNIIRHKSEASDQSGILNSGSENGSDGDPEETPKKLSWNQLLSDIKESWTNMFSIENSDADLMSTLSNSFGSLLGSVQPLIQIFNSSNPLLASLVYILKGFVDVMGPALQTVIAPIMDCLEWIGSTLASLFLPILDALYPSIAMIANIVSTVLAPIFQIISPFLQIIAVALRVLSSVIVLVGKAFTILMAPVQFVADLFSWLGKWLSYFGDCVGVAAWNLSHWFNQRAMPTNPGSFKSDAFTGLQSRLDSWDAINNSDNAVSNSVSTGTAVSSASYQGSTQVTINIYQQAPVVGDNGMRSFAQMIRNEFAALDYLGTTG